MENSVKVGYVSGDISQSNTTVYHAKIDTSVKRLEKDFNDGNIKQAMNDLSSLLEENKANSAIKYQLLVKKTSFLFALQKHNEAISLVNSIEKNYNEFLDIAYEEVKLIVLSLQKKEEDFFQIVDKIISESSEDLKRAKFELMYCLNIGDTVKAKTIFEILTDEERQSKELSVMGGHIYSNIKNYDKANTYYQIALSHDISFLDKVIIYEFYGTDIINKFIYNQKLNDNHKNIVEIYKDLIENIFNYEKYFNTSYISNLKNIYLYLLMVLDDQETYKVYFKNKNRDKLVFINHYFHWSHLTKAAIDHNKIQNIILEEKNEVLLMQYLHILNLKNNDSREVLNFLEVNKDFIYENKFVAWLYIQSKLQVKEIIEKDIIDFVALHKYENIEYLLSYIRLHQYQHINIDEDDLTKLINFAYDESTIFARITEVLDLLYELGKRKEYLDLAIQKQDDFDQIITHSLHLCFEDRNLVYGDFESFVNNIEDIELFFGKLGDIYTKFNDYLKAFEYYFKYYENNTDNTLLKFKLLEVVIRQFMKTKSILYDVKQKEVFDLVVQEKEKLDIGELVFLLQYSILITNDTKQVLPILNKKLLAIDVAMIDQELKIELSNLHTQTLFGTINNFDDLFLYDENICLEKNKLLELLKKLKWSSAVIKQNLKDFQYQFREFRNESNDVYIKYSYLLSKENIDRLGFIATDDDKYFIMLQDEEIKKKSLFHNIVGSFAYRINNPNFIPIEVDMDSDEPLSEFFSFVDNQHNKTLELFQKYSKEEYIGLFPLTNYTYENYFTLIPYLLTHNKFQLNSLKPTLLKDKKKILTLSSIVFLDHIGYLDAVLQRDDIVIQKTLINWFKDYIKNYKSINRPQDFSYVDDDNHTFIPFTEEEAKKAEIFRKDMIGLLTKLLNCNSIDDTTVNLPIGGAYEMLAKEMGVQEYHALAFCIANNYQIISENNIFDMLFNQFKYNKNYLGNSIGLLRDLLDQDDMFQLEQFLYQKKYQYLIHCLDEEKIIEYLSYDKFQSIINEQIILRFKIWYDYGCLDNIVDKYLHADKVIYPKNILTKEDIFYINMNYLLKKTNIQIDMAD